MRYKIVRNHHSGCFHLVMVISHLLDCHCCLLQVSTSSNEVLLVNLYCENDFSITAMEEVTAELALSVAEHVLKVNIKSLFKVLQQMQFYELFIVLNISRLIIFEYLLRFCLKGIKNCLFLFVISISTLYYFVVSTYTLTGTPTHT